MQQPALLPESTSADVATSLMKTGTYLPALIEFISLWITLYNLSIIEILYLSTTSSSGRRASLPEFTENPVGFLVVRLSVAVPLLLALRVRLLRSRVR